MINLFNNRKFVFSIIFIEMFECTVFKEEYLFFVREIIEFSCTFFSMNIEQVLDPMIRVSRVVIYRTTRFLWVQYIWKPRDRPKR